MQKIALLIVTESLSANADRRHCNSQKLYRKGWEGATRWEIRKKLTFQHTLDAATKLEQ